MSETANIRKELREAVTLTDSEILKRIEEELDTLEATDGLDGKPNIESFYAIWKRRRGQTAHKNDVNSWLAYAIGLTDQKPSGEFLPQRRAFARAGFPDIDTDFDDERRDEIYAYLKEKYGEDFVANIGAFQTLKLKKAVVEVSKAIDAAGAFNLGPDEHKTRNHVLAQDISNTLPAVQGSVRWTDGNGKTVIIKSIEQAYKTIPDFRVYMDKHPGIMEHAGHLQGHRANFTRHPAGVVISNAPLEEIAPLRMCKKGLATQFPYEDLESMGLIKFDILAIAALTVIRDAVEQVEANYGIKLDMENVNLRDQPTLALYRTGHLNGVFQCENYGMQKTMREIGVDSFNDVMAAIALYRPGPMDSIPKYVARKKGDEKVDYFHPTIEPHVRQYLEPTYGVLVYQEQVMHVCNALAGFSVSDGYVMIKAVGKKKQYLLDKFKRQFIQGCADKGVPEKVAEAYWDDFITPFADYGFNAAHSCCYGVLSFQTAFLKANYPDEFACAFMNTFSRRAMFKSATAWDQVHMMEEDARRRLGIKVLDRENRINQCDIFAKIVKKKDPSAGVQSTEILPGLCCKGLGYDAAKEIYENRPYKNLEDLAKKTDKTVSQEAIGALAEAGFFGKKGLLAKDSIMKKFAVIRRDLKASGSKGVESTDIFG